ncbi:MAG: prolyl oligopeptidase family serine peptidase [Candidatus Aminicenantes bacterium]|nr:prolyl oligopeptidase family serine peptidase [Candidatus Aminicenantes bacterium]
MRTPKTRTALLLVFASFFISYQLTPVWPGQSSENSIIFQTGDKIVIDGNLEEWSSMKEFPVNLSPAGEKIDASLDIAVAVRFAFDSENFYAALKAIDDRFEFTSRSWRYGDGFYLTFLDPYQGNTSDRFYSFGFSLHGDKIIKVLVNRDGEYFPEMSIQDIQLEIKPDTAGRSISYEISIPWKYIRPFKPFIHQEWGINLVYVDRDRGQSKVLQLYPDTDYDTELSDLRKGDIFRFTAHRPEKHEFQASINGSHYHHEGEKIITGAVNSPSESSNWKINYILSSAKATVSSVKNISLKKGMNLFRFLLEQEDLSSGSYDLSLGIIDNQDSLKFREDMRFFVLNQNEFEKLKSRLVQVKRNETLLEDTKFRESLPTLEIRFEWIDKFMKDSPPYADISFLDQWHQELDFLLKNVEEGKPALFLPGRLVRLAHRSEIDNTLQPYSVFIPLDYDEKTPTPLFVTLHGSGVDERRTIYSTTVNLQRARARRRLGKFIVLSPQARGLSDWYIGDSGKDVIECLDHVKKLYRIDERNIILDGFSMGGYGAWRLGLLYPKLFKAIIIRSGAVSVPMNLKGENILDLLDETKPKRMNIFIVHGDKDNAVPVKDARLVVKKLEELEIEFNYLEVKGAAHGGYDKWDEIFSWLKKIIEK